MVGHGGFAPAAFSSVAVTGSEGCRNGMNVASGAVLLRCYAVSWWLPWDLCLHCTRVEMEMVLRTGAGATSAGLVRWLAAFARWCRRLKMVELRCRRAGCRWCGAEMENGDGGGLVFRNVEDALRRRWSRWRWRVAVAAAVRTKRCGGVDGGQKRQRLPWRLMVVARV
ncbi:hypothetical protein DEO72_LG8g2105 [Vigna unguiculata]|uniref:Uncharacterized protein n=1 Tax=Vigna unguiculata TaxID=3917 RepID=A0A4D6MTX4_VIGUN|nr:hypothetical protein DEO72_LG8g2105 [Vigna unguiculata]